MYKHYGREIVAKVVGVEESHPDVSVVYNTVYRNFMEAVDAIDNGVNQWESDAPPRYQNHTHLSARVGNLNPKWNEESSGESLGGQRESVKKIKRCQR